MACKMLEECSVQEQQQSSTLTESFQKQLDRLQEKLEGLRGMRAMGDITREEFLHDKQNIQAEIDQLQTRIRDLSALSPSPVPALNIAQTKRTLDSWLDFSGPRISEELIEEFILQVVLIDDNTFNWTLDLSSHKTGSTRLQPNEMAMPQYRRCECAATDTLPDRHSADPQTLFTITITKEEAQAYCRSLGMKFFAKKWHDKTVIISI